MMLSVGFGLVPVLPATTIDPSDKTVRAAAAASGLVPKATSTSPSLPKVWSGLPSASDA